MCFSFNSAANRADFLANEDAYCAKFGLTPEQREAVIERNVSKLIAAGGNVYYLAKLAGIFGLDVQDIGAQQTGMSVEAFKAEARSGREIVMARIIGGIGTTHVPSIGKAIADRQAERSVLEARSSAASRRAWLACAREAGRGRGVLQRPRAQLLPRQVADLCGRRRERISQRGRGLGHSGVEVGARGRGLSWHLINRLVGDGFDMTICQEMLVDHAVTIPISLDVAEEATGRCRSCRSRSTPCSIRCPRWRAASSSAARSVARHDAYSEDIKVVMIGTGGLSHQLDGKRAGFINKDFDRCAWTSSAPIPEALTRYYDPGAGRAGRRAGRGIPQLDGDARRAHRHGERSCTATTTSRFPTPRRRRCCWRTAHARSARRHERRA